MIRRTKRAATIGIAVGALAIAGGAAFAASTQFGSKADQDALVADAAQRLGVSPQKLTDALQQAYDARVDAAVAAGQLTQAQGDALKQRAASGAGLPSFGGRGFG